MTGSLIMHFVRSVKVRLVRMCEPMSVLESEGRINLRAAEQEAALHNALGDESPP